jgi:predicted transposase/invertase (TIGR01784 family)
MEKRSLYYWAKKYSRTLNSGEDYSDLSAVVAVNIIGFGYFPVKDYHTSFHLWEDRHKELQLTDVCEIHFLDMVKFRKFHAMGGFNLDDPLNRWMVYFDKNSPQEMIKEVLNMDTTIQQFQEKLERINRDKAMMRIYDQYEKTELDWISSIKGAEKKGVAKTIELLKQGVSLEEIEARYEL